MVIRMAHASRLDLQSPNKWGGGTFYVTLLQSNAKYKRTTFNFPTALLHKTGKFDVKLCDDCDADFAQLCTMRDHVRILHCIVLLTVECITGIKTLLLLCLPMDPSKWSFYLS